MLCYDIMETVGTQVEQIRKTKEYKKNYNECIKLLNTSYYHKSPLDGSKFNLFDHWVENYMDADCWLSFLADNSDEIFVKRFYTPI